MPLFVSTVLLFLAVVLVVLTRMRLLAGESPAAGRVVVPESVVNAHTITGGLAIVVWGAYLFIGIDWVVGFFGLLLWWSTTVVGLLILMRWMPSQGRHASPGAGDSWTDGPALSVVGHVGALVGAVVWTTYFVLDKLS